MSRMIRITFAVMFSPLQHLKICFQRNVRKKSPYRYFLLSFSFITTLSFDSFLIMYFISNSGAFMDVKL